MTWLIGGIAFFTLLHLTSSLMPGVRRQLNATLGEKAYRGVYSGLVIAAFAILVIGWRCTQPIAIYAPPAWGQSLAFFLMFVSVVLFGASHGKTNIKRLVRHPQLAAVILWSVAHLASNGDSRSLVLFGSMFVWALLEIALINRRDGEWIKPPRSTRKGELITAAISVTVFLVLIALHPYFAGVSPLPA